MVEFVKKIPNYCHNCKGRIKKISCYSKLPRVTSDARPFPTGGQLAICLECGLAQAIINKLWGAECRKIYRNYKIYQESGGEEQAVFVGNTSVPRSQKIMIWLKKNTKLPTQGKILDFGCGNGAFLREFHSHYPEWELYGLEKDDRNLGKLIEIPKFKKLYVAGQPLPKNCFDLISLIHVLEHLPRPSEKLQNLRHHLIENGIILLQVPDAKKNPLISLIADHASHFTDLTLNNVCKRAGLFNFGKKWMHPIKRELTYLGKFSRQRIIRKKIYFRAFWIKALNKILKLSVQANNYSKKSPLIVFGSSIGAAWIYGACSGRVCKFFDEDPKKIGRSLLGKPILSINAMLKKSSDLIWVPSMDKKLKKKLRRLHLKIKTI